MLIKRLIHSSEVLISLTENVIVTHGPVIASLDKTEIMFHVLNFGIAIVSAA